jgi:signal transduction histidine kinase
LVRRVLENLISNGIKHTPTGGKLRIVIRTNSGTVRVAVHDEGPGVPLAARQRIFEKFGAITTRREQSYHSVGLGLAFCKLAIEAHGGSIGVEAAVPRGSVFWFELPS